MKKTLHRFYALIFALAAITFTGCTKNDTSTTVTGSSVITFVDNPYGYFVAPSVASTSSATFNGAYNPSTHVFSWIINYNLSGRPVLTIRVAQLGASSGRIISEYVSAQNATGTGTISDYAIIDGDVARELLQGNVYYEFATAANPFPGGEIRGQLKLNAK